MSVDAQPIDSSYPDQPSTVPSAVSPFRPVAGAERIASVDVLRGFALLGILAINIYFFALPGAVMFKPQVAGGFDGLNLLTWKTTTLLFLQKMMGIFSMLFGAGLILMSDRAKSAGKKYAGVYYRRILWLLVFGLAHGYLLWHGDILFSYAICGLLLYPVRRFRPWLLLVLGALVLSFGIMLQAGSGMFFGFLKPQAEAARAAEAAGETLTPQQEMVLKQWEGLELSFNPPPEQIAKEVEAFRGDFWEMFTFRAWVTLMMQTQALFFMVFWRALGLMLLGMALMKLGVFSGTRSLGFYALLAILGYGIGLALTGHGMNALLAHDFDFIYRFKIGGHYSYVGNVLISLGHVGLLMIIYKTGILTWLTRRLAAVGRMALTNYLVDSIVFTTIFYGYGLGLFNQIERFGLMGFVLGMWILKLVISPIWLRYFRFGPAEWLWRTLTYLRRQPMRVAQPPPEG